MQRLRWNSQTDKYEYEDPTFRVEVEGDIWAYAYQQRIKDGMSEDQAEEETRDAAGWTEDLEGVTYTKLR